MLLIRAVENSVADVFAARQIPWRLFVAPLDNLIDTHSIHVNRALTRNWTAERRKYRSCAVCQSIINPSMSNTAASIIFLFTHRQTVDAFRFL